ncbi:DUF1801 domain-containing protein [Gilvimarinus polysaccharolyticus]|uniref:DUF1801 domain-containing protein n=1 Tax=Gilvimarinus polysaccharolyticus TaxID=863921 RepID=UPI0006739CEF|nr:DUF1801 domain-containing protein [Gilvimarinus polysaccharolyticus]
MDISVNNRFKSYPENARSKIEILRGWIFEISASLDLGKIEESLKWGEPSYSVKTGSPIRIDWKPKSPNNCYLLFNCNTTLVDTFRELYGNLLEFQGNRAIVVSLSEELPEAAIKHCIELGLTYKTRKHLPLLGT